MDEDHGQAVTLGEGAYRGHETTRQRRGAGIAACAALAEAAFDEVRHGREDEDAGLLVDDMAFKLAQHGCADECAAGVAPEALLFMGTKKTDGLVDLGRKGAEALRGVALRAALGLVVPDAGADERAEPVRGVNAPTGRLRPGWPLRRARADLRRATRPPRGA